MRVVDLRREAGYPLSAPLLAELGADRGERRQGDPAAQPPRDRAGAALPRLRDDASAARTATSRSCCTATSGLHCHHCGHVEPAPEACPVCRSAELARIGAGTQRLERELAAKVPELELIRLDADTAANPEELAAALRRFRETDRAVLLGTQMVAKGHHFAGVELAAVVDADTGLGLPDFRAEERTFQLVTQLAGRSGRDAPGRVLVQTFQPDARPLALAAQPRRAALPGRRAGAAARARLPALPPPRARGRDRAGRARAVRRCWRS